MRWELKMAMVEKGFNNETLATHIGISPTFMSQIATGNRNPRLETAIKIAQTLEKPVDTLFRDVVSVDQTGTED